MPQALIYINSWPGVGKNAIAQAVATHLGPDTRVIPNYLHFDLAEAILPRTSPDYQPLRQRLRETFFQTLIESRDTWDHVYVLTDFQTSTPLGCTVAESYRSCALARNSVFIPVILDCELEENARRLASRERIERVERDGRGILVDADLLREMRRDEELYGFGVPEERRVDVSGLDAEEAARRLAEEVRRIVGEEKENGTR